MYLLNIHYHAIIPPHIFCSTLVLLPSIFSGMSSFGCSYQKVLFATLERQLEASLEVSGWRGGGIKLV